MTQLKRHQAAMLTKVLGGPDRYSGRDLGPAHAELEITPEAYGRVGEHLMGVGPRRRSPDAERAPR